MSLDYAILGMLDLMGEQSGYDLSNELMISVGNVWYADRPQIYRSLAKLEKKGWVVSREDVDNPRNRKVYQITGDGQTAFQQFLESPYETNRIRRPNLLRLFFSKRVETDIIRDQIIGLQRELQGYMEGLKYAEQGIAESTDEFPDDAFFWNLTLQQGLMITKALREWTDYVLNKLDEREKAQKNQQDNEGE